MVFSRNLTVAISFLLVGIVISQDVKQQIKSPVKGIIKSKRPGRVFDSKFYGSKFGSFYKPEDFLEDGNSTKSSIPTSTVKISTLDTGSENSGNVKGRKLPPQNDFQFKGGKFGKALIQADKLSPAKLSAEGITEHSSTETTEIPEATTEPYLTTTVSE